MQREWPGRPGPLAPLPLQLGTLRFNCVFIYLFYGTFVMPWPLDPSPAPAPILAPCPLSVPPYTSRELKAP